MERPIAHVPPSERFRQTEAKLDPDATDQTDHASDGTAHPPRDLQVGEPVEVAEPECVAFAGFKIPRRGTHNCGSLGFLYRSQRVRLVLRFEQVRRNSHSRIFPEPGPDAV